MSNIRDIKKLRGGLNTDDNPGSLPPEDYTFAKNVRTLSSDEQHGAGLAETLQSEIELLLGVEASITYYGEAIGGSFIYHGYEEVTIGTQVWMKKNYDAQYPGSKAYDDEELNVPLYGRLYTHHQVMSSNFCPPGWRVPTEADIDTLLTHLGGAMIAGGKLKEAGEQDWVHPNTGATDEAGFRALPGGKFDLLFDLLGDNCLLWLQDEAEPDAPVAIAATEIGITSFLANWESVVGADGYYLDVATDAAFTMFLAGFNNLDVGKVLSYPVTGAGALTPYYYRVRAYNEIGSSGNSNTITNTTLDGVTDFDGNVYTYVTIGTQQWMVENFRSEHYIDGTVIPIITLTDDWFLPSQDELNAMYTELYLHGVGNFVLTTTPAYWTSTEKDANYAYYQLFSTGGTSFSGKGSAFHIRPCRTFTAGLGEYVLRDTGPSGGLIFYVSGTTYMEAAISNLDIGGDLWSNITSVLIGATAQGTAIGTGVTNTAAIVGQVGCIDGAALDCYNIEDNYQWVNDTTGAMCYYDNDEATYKPDYGALYNWYAVDNAHGLAPAGWRVPTMADFATLSAYIGGDAIGGEKLKESGLTHWNSAVGTNDFGFLLRGAGRRYNLDGTFDLLKTQTFLWTQENHQRAVYYNQKVFIDFTLLPASGLSVRLMRDV